MKYVLVFGLVLIVFWLWRSGRQASAHIKNQPHARKNQAKIEKATEIVACQVCQVHLPRSEALSGDRGMYCSTEHQQQAGDQA